MDLLEVQKRNDTQIARHPWELARFEIVHSLLSGVIENREDFNVLDIGCGDIFFISNLSERYPKANFYAVDTAFTDEIMEHLAKEINGKRIYLFKTLDEATLHLKKQADLVLLLDVVEHIEHDKQFLTSLYHHTLITKDTRIMITVPAFQNLFCSHDHFLGHYRRYTNNTLRKVVRESGFEKVEKIGYFFATLIPPRIIQVMKEKTAKPEQKRETTGLVEWKGGNAVTGFIKNVLLLDFKFCNLIKKISGLSLPGLSNYIICKKPA